MCSNLCATVFSERDLGRVSCLAYTPPKSVSFRPPVIPTVLDWLASGASRPFSFPILHTPPYASDMDTRVPLNSPAASGTVVSVVVKTDSQLAVTVTPLLVPAIALAPLT